MQAPIKKVAIVGVGAVGGVFAHFMGANLASQNIELSAIATGKTLETLRAEGVTLIDSAGEAHTTKLKVSDNPADLGPQDLVIVAVKGPAVQSVAPIVRALLAPHTTVLVAMNGVPWWFFDGFGGECEGLALAAVDPNGVIAENIPTAHVLGCVVHLSSQSPRSGRIEQLKGKQLILGEPSGGASDRANAVAALLNEAGFEVKVSAQIQQDIWFKLWGNMTMNPVSAITGAPCDQILDDALVRSFCSAVMLEAQAIGHRIGCAIAQNPEDRHGVTRRLGSFKTSMLQDVENGRSIELDNLVSAVRDMGQHLKLATPNIDALLGLTRLMARVRGLYPKVHA